MKAEQTDIFSLFGLEDEYETKKKEVVQEKKKQSEVTKKNNNTASKTGDPFEVNEHTIIKYYVDEIPITQYFSDAELVEGIPSIGKGDKVEYKKIDGEELRKRMENDYAQFISGMIQMVFIKKKNMVIPVLQAQKKGQYTKTSPLSFIVPSNEMKIPYSILQDFISISRHFASLGTEVHGDIYLNGRTKQFFLRIPKQRAHKYWVETTELPIEEAVLLLEENAFKVMEIHSHHTMPPLPSSQDDESERAPILYAILGHLDSFFPSITCRTFDPKKEIHIPLSPWKVFENPFIKSPPNYDLTFVEVI